jgi:signal transduction histidine kinase
VPPEGSNLKSHIARDAAEQARLPEHLRKLGPGRHAMIVGNEETHVLVREFAGIRYLVVYEVGLHERRESEFKLLVMLSVLTAALVSLALGYWLSGLLVSQITELARAVGRLKPGDAREPLAAAGQDPEVATLARALDAYRANMEQMMRREQEFTANASHELRTPLTAIQTSCELLLADPGVAGRSRQRVERVNEAAQRMGEQIQALLLLARGQEPGRLEPVVLADCVAEAVEPYRAEISRKGLAMEVEIGRDDVLDLNHQALRFVLANLIRNAVSYTERGFVKVGYTAKRLSVADSGRGIAPENLPRIFERFFRAEGIASGAGLGLSIVKRICDHYGWRIDVSSALAKGTTFSITFP